MAKDTPIGDLSFIAPSVARDLNDLDIRSARQLFHRLRQDRAAMSDYLDLEPGALEQIEKELHDLMQQHFPQELTPLVAPLVSKRGVAVHRVEEEAAKFYGGAVYTPTRRR